MATQYSAQHPGGQELTHAHTGRLILRPATDSVNLWCPSCRKYEALTFEQWEAHPKRCRSRAPRGRGMCLRHVFIWRWCLREWLSLMTVWLAFPAIGWSVGGAIGYGLEGGQLETRVYLLGVTGAIISGFLSWRYIEVAASIEAVKWIEKQKRRG